MTFFGVVGRMIGARPLRSLVTAFAVAIGVSAVMALSVLTYSLRATATSIMQTGKADFTVAQFGSADLLNSTIDERDVDAIRSMHGVASAVGTYVATANLGASQPFFLEIGLNPNEQAAYGVIVVRGRSYGPTAPSEIMLCWRAALHLGVTVGARVHIEELSFTVTGIYNTGNAVGDEGAMFPLPTLQAWHRKPGLVTLIFVRAQPGVDIPALRRAIERAHPQLTTVKTLTEFGNADRNLVLIQAANAGGSLLALIIGATGVMNTSLLSFYERIREFGLLRAVGWSRRRVFSMVVLEALAVSLLGAGLGVLLGFAAVRGLTHLPHLVGVFRPSYDTAIFTRALSFAFGMAVLGALYPAAKAAQLSPLDALRRET
mgnify:FL=1